MKIGIIHKHHDKKFSEGLARAAMSQINEREPHSAEIYKKGKEYDTIMTIGGDGTVLRGHRIAPIDVPLFCVNSGTVGYLTDVPSNKLREGIDKLLACDGIIYSYDTLVGDLDGGNLTQTAINEILMKLGAPTHMIETEIYIDGEFIDTVLGDAFIVSTALGSTAYSYSAGGSVLHPNCECLILTVVAPYKPFTPIVVPNTSEILLVPQREYTEKIVICDGDLQKQRIYGVNGTLKIRRTDQQRQFIKVFAKGYFEKIIARRR